VVAVSLEQKDQVLKLIKRKRLENRVYFNEPDPDIVSVLSESSLLCIFSLWEGFPNILAEALSMGIPGIGFQQCDGVNELLIDELNGVLVYDDETDACIAKGLLRCESLITNGKITTQNCKSSVANYSEAIVQKQWDSFIRR
jgi:GalNAc-alpha-(1->4)-GalNAc-alpha-(1->3)-diNAcBac-PP-undecaprenol alpha-1,4-N-acetyl-D-galactosaminyltransferase